MERPRAVLAWLMGTLLLALTAVGGGDSARSQAGESSDGKEAAICPAYRPSVEARLVSVRRESVYEEFGTPLGRCGFVIVQGERPARQETTEEVSEGTTEPTTAFGEGRSAEAVAIARAALEPWLDWLTSLDWSAWDGLRSLDWQFCYAGPRGREAVEPRTSLAALELPCALDEVIAPVDPWFARAWGKVPVKPVDPWFARAWGKEPVTPVDPWFAQTWGGDPTRGGLGDVPAAEGSLVGEPEGSTIHLGTPTEYRLEALKGELPWWIWLAEPGAAFVVELPPPPIDAVRGTKVARGLELDLCREPLVWLNVWGILNQWTLVEPRGIATVREPLATVRKSRTSVVRNWSGWLRGVDVIGEVEAALALNRAQEGHLHRQPVQRVTAQPAAQANASKYYDWSAHFHSLWRGTDLERPAAVSPLRHAELPSAEELAAGALEPTMEEGSHFELILDGPERYLYLRCREVLDWSQEPAIANLTLNGCTPLDHLAIRALRESGELAADELVEHGETSRVRSAQMELLNWTDGWFGCEAFPSVAQQAVWPSTESLERWTDACNRFEEGLRACHPWLAVWGRLNQQVEASAFETSRAMLGVLAEMNERHAADQAAQGEKQSEEAAAVDSGEGVEGEPSAVGASYGWESEMLLGL